MLQIILNFFRRQVRWEKPQMIDCYKLGLVIQAKNENDKSKRLIK
jgi:hypothetical protein